MTVTVTSITDTSNTNPAAVTINTPWTVFSVAAQSYHYTIEGYIDLGQMQTGDTLSISESVELDGSNYRAYNTQTFYGAQSFTALRFHGKLFGASMLYEIVLTQTAGTGRKYPYFLMLQLFSV